MFALRYVCVLDGYCCHEFANDVEQLMYVFVRLIQQVEYLRTEVFAYMYVPRSCTVYTEWFTNI